MSATESYTLHSADGGKQAQVGDFKGEIRPADNRTAGDER